MRTILLASLILISACASNSNKRERLKQEHPECEVSDDMELECPSPLTETFPATPDEKLSKIEVEEVLETAPQTKKLTRDCKLQETPNPDALIVGKLPKGKKVSVDKATTRFFSYYYKGRLVFIDTKCFSVEKKRGKKR